MSSSTSRSRPWGGGDTGLDGVILARTADVVFLLDPTTGTAAHRWYDPATSRLDLPGEPDGQQLADAVRPDDLPQLLEAFAKVTNGSQASSAYVRLRPDSGYADDAVLLVRFRALDDLWEQAVLIQVWVIDSDSVVRPELDVRESLSSLGAVAPVGLQVVAPTGPPTFENDRFRQLVEPDRAAVDAVIDAAVAAGTERVEDVLVGPCCLRLRVAPTLDGDGQLVHAVVSVEDVTRLTEAEAGRELAEGQFDALFESSPIATALVALDGRIVRSNEAFSIVVGYERDELSGLTFQEITHPDDVAADESLLAEVLAGERRSYQMEKRYVHRSGHDVWVELTVAPVRDGSGSVQHLVTHVEDITSRRSMFGLGEEEGDTADLEYWATHDHLTALPNRRYLEHHLELSLRCTRRQTDRVVVVFIDLDDFKPINDEYGHDVGDEVLRAAARRLRSACREDAVVTRWGGDEFVIAMRRLRSAAEVPYTVDRIAAAFNSPVVVGDHVLRVGASIGTAISRDGDDVAHLLRRADEAAYEAKRFRKRSAAASA